MGSQGARAAHPARPRRLLAACAVLIAANVVLRVLLAASFPLFFPEAMLWEWGRFPSLGYLAHPPLPAWVVGAWGVVLPDRSVLALRLPSLLLGLASLGLIWHVAKGLFSSGSAPVWSLVLASCLPVLLATGVLMVGESPMVFFHLLSLWLFSRALREGRGRDWYLAGLAAGLAMLCDLLALPMLLGYCAFLVTSRPHRFWLRRRQPYLAGLLALLVLCPYVYWNWSEGWPAVRLWVWHFARPRWGLRPTKVLEFGLEQMGNAGVFLFVPIVGVVFVRTRRLPELWRGGFGLVRCQCAAVLAGGLVASLVAETHPSWTAIAYPSGVLALGALAACCPRHVLVRRLKALVALSAAAVLLVCASGIAFLPRMRAIPPAALGRELGRKLCVGNLRLFGWRDLHPELGLRLRGLPPDDALLFTDDPKLGAVLSFCGGGEPVVHLRPWVWGHLQSDDAQIFYFPWKSLRGRGGVFVASMVGEFDPAAHLPRLFVWVEELAPVDLCYAGQVIMRYRLFRVRGFHGRRPAAADVLGSAGRPSLGPGPSLPAGRTCPGGLAPNTPQRLGPHQGSARPPQPPPARRSACVPPTC